MEMKKIYVNSGAMRWVGMATSPLDAIKKALAAHGNHGPLNSLTVFLDERGFRTDTAQYQVPIEQALIAAGYTFENDQS